MPAAQVELSEILSHQLACARSTFEELDEDAAVALLLARFRVISSYGWDWGSAVLLAVDVELPAHETAALAPAVPAPIVLQ